LPSFPFDLARRNFYSAAQHGLDAELAWPLEIGAAPRRISARELIAELVPRVRAGLVRAGVADDEAWYFLDVFAQRAATGATGASWQRRTLASLEARGQSRPEALRAMLEHYIVRAESGVPVHRWE
jgi:hypothetical protein